MATNNYFGFTHGGTQYGTSGAAAYQAAAAASQTGYAVTPASGAPATYQTQRAATTGYESAYQAATTHTAPGTYVAGGTTAAGTTYDYGYGRPAQSTAPAYDGSKTYYQQPAVAATASGTYSGAETHYQAAAKPAFSTPSSSYNVTTRQVTPTTTPKATNAYGNAGYNNQGAGNYATGYAAPAQANNTGYDTALYNAATMYVQQQSQAQVKPQTGVANTWQFKKGNLGGQACKLNKPKQPPKPQQLHYCDVCKISCAGPQTYREHLEGQKHKKKEAALKAGTATATRGGNALRCELCDVTCTGSDAYAAHIRGVKHQKVVKLHTKLGKPIPSNEPLVMGSKTGTTTAAASTSKPAGAPGQVAVGVKKPSAVPKINFTAAGGAKEEEEDTSKAEEAKIEEKEIQPVGQDYIEEIRNDEGKVVSFNCKLCECRFNDPNAKEMHMKGRRHRLQYKKKVNPDLIVDIKPSLRQRKLQEEKMRRQHLRDEYFRRRDEERLLVEEEERMFWEERRRYEEEMEWFWRHGRDHRGPPMRPPFGPGGPPPHMMFFPSQMRRPDSSDDRHMSAKHQEIYPTEDELQAVQRIVSHTEKALKQVSDQLVDAQGGTTEAPAATTAPAPEATKEIKVEKPDEQSAVKKEDGRDGSMFSFHRSKEECAQNTRTLKGVMRVGVLAKGLLLKGDTSVRLVVLCADKPTVNLLNQVASMLPVQLKSVCSPEDAYEVSAHPQQGSIHVRNNKNDLKITVEILLTSPVVREAPGESAPAEPVEAASRPVGNLLDKQQCLEALAALRHAKWFQARATGLQHCVMVIRVLKDLCARVPTWAPFPSWALELLCEKVLSSAGQPQSPGDALRRVMEAVASGILLPGGPGLLDPCEKEPTDAAGCLTVHQREDITASAQHALRLLAFRRIHEVLGMEQLPPPKFQRGRFNRKRRRDNSSGEGNDSEGENEPCGDGKKDKKEDGEEKMDTEKTAVNAAA
ncbi:zinc finger RNA-binding protein isoform X2 [Neocloeon triangulifer]|uniref:zinc finger RNA-binding protein isoform X2 n=1 Tax=Neocloeon triangulifer TaxID=2078957 RepID=UPI00286F06CC|nr:zinc finger RNA-binding protein isoform X2 [Neocloeon triangulifer]